MHMILVREDLGTFAHIHPEPTGTDGVLAVTATFPTPGTYGVHTEFRRQGQMTDVLDSRVVTVAGTAPTPVRLPSTDVREQVVDGVRIGLRGDAQVGETSDFTLTFADAGTGRPVTDLQPYLGAFGHLVALRDGDLAYLHVHPDGSTGAAGPEISFTVEVPSAGAYGLFLDFRHGDAVHTAAFTATAKGTR
jgi:Cu+-exporting ATPase